MFIYFLSPFIHNDCLSAVQRLIAETFGNFADRATRRGGGEFLQRGGGEAEPLLMGAERFVGVCFFRVWGGNWVQRFNRNQIGIVSVGGRRSLASAAF